jgi:hypothetical protein
MIVYVAFCVDSVIRVVLFGLSVSLVNFWSAVIGADVAFI